MTGATGFVGQHLVRLLCDRGWQVDGLVPPGEEDRRADPRMRRVPGDITNPTSLRGTMDGVDAVFHLAALVDSWVRDPTAYYRVNVAGTENVIEEALRSRVPRFVFTSSISGIGVQRDAVAREDSPPGEVFGPYEASKAEAEKRVAAAVRARGLPAVVVIPGIILGPGDLRNTGKFLLAFARGEFPGTFAEESVLPVVDVGDVARAHLRAFERGTVGSRYIVCGENTTWGELLRIASEASGTPMPSRHYGNRTVRFGARVSELRARITRRPPTFPPWLADFMLTGARMDNSKSVAELGMTYTPISESIESALKWYREQGILPPMPGIVSARTETETKRSSPPGP